MRDKVRRIDHGSYGAGPSGAHAASRASFCASQVCHVSFRSADAWFPTILPCGRIRNVIALPHATQKSLSAALRQDVKAAWAVRSQISGGPPAGLSVNESKQKNCYPSCQRARGEKSRRFSIP